MRSSLNRRKREVANMIKAFAILFADNYRQDDLHGLVRSRTLASLPVGSRYRLVDFMLSSLVKAGIDNIGILTNHNYKSLRDHVGWGKDWDLNRKNSGLTLITPLSNYLSPRIPQNKIEALVNTMVYTEDLKEEYCILADTNIIGTIDFKESGCANKNSIFFKKCFNITLIQGQILPLLITIVNLKLENLKSFLIRIIKYMKPYTTLMVVEKNVPLK